MLLTIVIWQAAVEAGWVGRTVALSLPRHGHVASVLETGPLILAGGLGDNGQPLASIDIYTP